MTYWTTLFWRQEMLLQDKTSKIEKLQQLLHSERQRMELLIGAVLVCVFLLSFLKALRDWLLPRIHGEMQGVPVRAIRVKRTTLLKNISLSGKVMCGDIRYRWCSPVSSVTVCDLSYQASNVLRCPSSACCATLAVSSFARAPPPLGKGKGVSTPLGRGRVPRMQRDLLELVLRQGRALGRQVQRAS